MICDSQCKEESQYQLRSKHICGGDCTHTNLGGLHWMYNIECIIIAADGSKVSLKQTLFRRDKKLNYYFSYIFILAIMV